MKPAILLPFLFAALALSATEDDEQPIAPSDDFHYSLWNMIASGGLIQMILQTANLGVCLYVLVRSVLAWRRYRKPPPASALISLSLVPIFLSTIVALVYLSQLLTSRQYHSLRVSGAINDVIPDGIGPALLIIDDVRMSLYSGLLFSTLILITFCATRKLNSI